MIVKISPTGFWEASHAHLEHHFSLELSNWICQYFSSEIHDPVYDFGCGLGSYLSALQIAGFKNLTGFEGDPPHEKKFSNIVCHDLTKPISVPKKGSCIFLEVAEHVPREFEQTLLSNVSSACNKKMIMSWATRGQGGHGHVNELNNNEAIDKLEKFGFKYMNELSKEVRALNHGSAHWFQNTLLVFEK